MEFWRDDANATALAVAVGVDARFDLRRSVIEAAALAHARLGPYPPRLALVVTAGDPHDDPVESVRSVLGQVAVAGGASTGILTRSGLVERGALVVAFAPDVNAESGAACVSTSDLADAGSSAARIVMAGWPFRLQYPRGLGIVFAASGSPISFLEAWRHFMGPKMRTACAVMPGRAVWGTPARRGVASAACLEAGCISGLGFAQGFPPGTRPHPDMLRYTATEAMRTALKRIDEHSTRVVLTFDTTARRQVLGDDAHDEQWSDMLAEVGERTPCVGWLCDRVAGYGRGIRLADEHGALLVAALGETSAKI